MSCWFWPMSCGLLGSLLTHASPRNAVVLQAVNGQRDLGSSTLGVTSLIALLPSSPPCGSLIAAQFIFHLEEALLLRAGGVLPLEPESLLAIRGAEFPAQMDLIHTWCAVAACC